MASESGEHTLTLSDDRSANAGLGWSTLSRMNRCHGTLSSLPLPLPSNKDCGDPSSVDALVAVRTALASALTMSTLLSTDGIRIQQDLIESGWGDNNGTASTPRDSRDEVRK